MTTNNKLPVRPSLENLKKRAKQFHKRVQAGETGSMALARERLPRLSAIAEAEVLGAGVTLQEVQYVIAVEYGYAKWSELITDIGKKDSTASVARRLFGRPSLESLKQRAKHVHKMVKDGEPGSASRVRNHLPRLADIPDAEVPNAGLTLEEVQQVIAAEYGYSRWDELAADISLLRPVSSFEDLANLEGGEIEEVIARVGRDALAVAMKAASDHFKNRFLGIMTAEERRMLTEYMEWLGPMLRTEVEAVQRGIVEKFRSEPVADAAFV